MPRFPVLMLSAAALTVGLAACGGSGSSSSSSTTAAAAATSSSTPASTSSSSAAAAGSSAGTLSVAADPSGQLKFDKTALTAKAGKVTISFTNKAPEDHNFTLQTGTNGATVAGTPTFKGGTKAITVSLKPGTYTFFCSVPGHRMGGMQGTLTVS